MDKKLENFIKFQIKVYESELKDIARRIFDPDKHAMYQARLLGIVYGLMVIESILTIYDKDDLPELKSLTKKVGAIVDEL